MSFTPIMICTDDDLPTGQARCFCVGDAADRFDIILWRQRDTIRGFVNACPHLHTPLETFPHRLLDASGTQLICSTHGARFNQDGLCVSGPCVGRALTPLTLTHTADGKIMLARPPYP